MVTVRGEEKKEAWPFYPPLDEGDMRLPCVHLPGFWNAGLSNRQLYTSIDWKAN